MKNSTVKCLQPMEGICQRLHEQSCEDRDVEIIINNLLDMGRYQSMKMFSYGAFFTEKQNQQ